jgi:hypothetical protein
LSVSIDRATICDYYIKSLRLGELSAAELVAPYFAEDVVARFDENEFVGREKVALWTTGKWPVYQQWPRPGVDVLRKGGWSVPVEEGDHFVVTAEFPPYIIRRTISRVEIYFNDENLITRIEHATQISADPTLTTDKIPTVVRGLVNDALANFTPMTVGYVSDENKPVLSLRGSIQFYGEKQLSVWLRHAEGGMATSLQKNPAIHLVYFDPVRLISLYIIGRAHIEDDEATVAKVFDLLPELEQKHDPDRLGACLIIDIESIKGNLASGALVCNL